MYTWNIAARAIINCVQVLSTLIKFWSADQGLTRLDQAWSQISIKSVNWSSLLLEQVLNNCSTQNTTEITLFNICSRKILILKSDQAWSSWSRFTKKYRTRNASVVDQCKFNYGWVVHFTHRLLRTDISLDNQWYNQRHMAMVCNFYFVLPSAILRTDSVFCSILLQQMRRLN